MNRFSQAERQQLLNYLHIGKPNAINAQRIATHMGFPAGGNQVKNRDLIRECIEYDGDLILSSLSKPKCFYKCDINNKAEFEQHLDLLENRASDILHRRNNLIQNWNNLVLQNPILNIV